MTELEWPRQRTLIGGGHFVGHLRQNPYLNLNERLMEAIHISNLEEIRLKMTKLE